MSECPKCAKEMIMCTCPKGLGSGEPDASDLDFEEKLDEVSGEILAKYADIIDSDPSVLQAFIDMLQEELGLADDHELIDLLSEGITSIHEAREFKEQFKALEPNLAMLEAVSNKLGLAVFPNPSIDMPSARAALLDISSSAHVPAVTYACVEPSKEERDAFVSGSVSVGKKTQESPDAHVDDKTKFPASSLSKVVFTYLVLELVKDGQLDLDEPLHNILQNERFLVDGEYPDKAKALTARHVLSHTTGLPNMGSGSSSTLRFNPDHTLGEGYSYSGEAIFYLQQVVEAKTGKDLETLADEYVFTPLGMENTTFVPPLDGSASDLVAVHTELGRPESIYVGEPPANAAGSLLTTGEDFSKFMRAWLENMDDPVIKQAFEPTSADDFMTCGLGWHIYRKGDQVIAYQYGENPNTRALAAINLTERTAAAFFTNSENGMSIADSIFRSPDLVAIGDLKELYERLHYTQCTEAGWQETLSGRVAEVEGHPVEARIQFEKALDCAPDDPAKRARLEWFDAANNPPPAASFSASLGTFSGTYKNQWNDEVELSVKDDCLVFKQFDQEIRLVRVSENEFLPAKDQSIKLKIDGGAMSLQYVQGFEKTLSKQPEPNPMARYREALATLRAEADDSPTPTEGARREGPSSGL